MDIVLFNQSNTALTPEQDLILIDFFGYSSGVFVGITLLPQVIKVFKTQSTKDLSHIFLALSLLASVSKLIYGILINQLPIVVTAPIIGFETLIIMIAKCIFDKRMNEINDTQKNESSNIELIELGDNPIIENIENIKRIIEGGEVTENIVYKKDNTDIIISKDKIIINTIELEFQKSTIQNILKFISK